MKTYKKGKFSSIYDSSKNIGIADIIKWKLFQKPKKHTPVPLDLETDLDTLHQTNDFICWLSHASFLIQLGGKRILLDPVFNDIPFYKRKIPIPYTVKALGNIDYVLISHTHYDHCDKTSLRALVSKTPTVIVPLKMTSLMNKIMPNTKILELDWYKHYQDGDLKISFVPARHWGRRGLFDKNTVLWGGYILQYKHQSIYFSGDTSFGSHFEEIAEHYNIDIALLPIGAYAPEFIMKENHMNPHEAFDAFGLLKAKRMIPMHYGTYKLTDEPLDEPLSWMQKIASKHPDKVCFLKAGEVLKV